MSTAGGNLPALWHGDRRGYLLGAIAYGVLLASLAGLGAWGTYRAVSTGSLWWVSVICLSALGVAAATAGGRVTGERLGQSFVQELRVDLIHASLRSDGTTSPGVLIARATNDLTAVRTWISLGVAPLITAVPLVVGASLALGALHPILAIGFGSLIVGAGVLLGFTGPVLYRRARAVRRRRGRLARAVSDVVVSRSVIRSATGEDREARRVGRLGKHVAAASIERARVSGAVRGVVAGVGGLATAVVVASSLGGRLDPASMSAALLVVGLTVTPLGELGRALEYRQNYLAARVILVRALSNTGPTPQIRSAKKSKSAASVTIRGLTLTDWTVMDDVSAFPGDRLILDCSNDLARAAVSAISSGESVRSGSIEISGSSVRSSLGVARGTDPLPPGSIERIIRYRVPTASEHEMQKVLRSMKMYDVVNSLPRGLSTRLGPWGDPLSPSQRVLLNVARAVIGSPSLLVLDGVRSELGPAHVEALELLVAQFPGVVITTDRGYPGTWSPWTDRSCHTDGPRRRQRPA